MYVKKNCVGCGACIPYCPMKALSLSEEGVARVDRVECVECGACVRTDACPVRALHFEDLPWPRVVRRLFSDPNFSHSTTTQGMGRGTAEMKSNDVTGRYKRGEAGIGIELGRPSVGVWFRDIEAATTYLISSLRSVGITFEEKNPLTALMDDPEKGTFKKEVMNEKLLSTIIEFRVPASGLAEAMRIVKGLESRIDTVFSVFVATRAEEDGSLPNLRILEEAGYAVSLNAKINVGLGRPYFEEKRSAVPEAAEQISEPVGG